MSSSFEVTPRKSTDAVDLQYRHIEAAMDSNMDPSLLKMWNGIVLVPQPSDDESDPLNWTMQKKYTTLAVWAFGCFSTQACAMANQQGYFKQASLYGKTPLQVSYSVSTALGGLTAGAMIAVPLQRKFGICFCFLWSMVGLLASQIWSACMTRSDEYNAFVVSRLFAGLFAGGPLVFGSQMVMQIFFLHERGRAFHILHIPYLTGVVAGPTIGGFIISNYTWTIQFWWTAALCIVTLVLILIFLEDTEYNRGGPQDFIHTHKFASIIKRRVSTYFYANAIQSTLTSLDLCKILWEEVTIGLRPVNILAGLFLMVDFGFGTMAYVLVIIFLEDPVTAGGYGYNSVQAACFTFALWIALAVAELYGHFVSDRLPLWLSQKRGQQWLPEYRLYCLVAPVIALAIGLGLFGAALQYHLHYMVLALGSFLIQYGSMSIVPITMTYLCEIFEGNVPEVSAIMGLYRLGLGLSTPFFVSAWIERVSIGWVFGSAAFLTIPAFSLISLLLWKGPYIRAIFSSA